MELRICDLIRFPIFTKINKRIFITVLVAFLVLLPDDETIFRFK